MSLLPVAILAGGLARRLGSLTAAQPKSLIEVAGRPFLFHQLELLRSQGIEQVVLCTGHFGEQIRQAAGDGRAFDLKIRYSDDGPALLGTGGALKRALPLMGEHFFVLNGDSYLRCDYAQVQAAFERSGRRALMTVLHNADRWDLSNVLLRDGELLAYSKERRDPAMAHIDYGLSVLSAAALAPYPPGVLDLAEICESLAAQGELAAFEVRERFYEIGSPAGLAETEEFLRRLRAVA